MPPPLEKDIPKPTLQTLPERKRDPHPGNIARGPTRRTSAQVAADKKRQEELKQSLEEIAKRKVEILAEMEVQQQINDEEEELRVIKTLADIESLEKVEDSGDDSGDTEIEGSDSKVADISRSEDVAETRVPPVKVTVSSFPEIIIRCLTEMYRGRRSLVKGKCGRLSMLRKLRSKGKRESCL